MRWDKLTLMSQEAFQQAQSKAEELGHQELNAEHILWASLSQEESVILSILAKIGVSIAKVRQGLEESLERIPKVEGAGEVYLSSTLRQIMSQARKEADRRSM